MEQLRAGDDVMTALMLHMNALTLWGARNSVQENESCFDMLRTCPSRISSRLGRLGGDGNGLSFARFESTLNSGERVPVLPMDFEPRKVA